MKKFLLLLLISLFTSTIVKANDSFNTYVKNLATCTPYKHTSFFMIQIDQEILGWENGSCLLRDINYTFDIPRGTDIFSLTKEQLKPYIIPSSASVYSLTRNQLVEYQKSLINGIKNTQNKTSISVSTQNMHNKVKAVKNYEYKNGSWVNSDVESYLMY